MSLALDYSQVNGQNLISFCIKHKIKPVEAIKHLTDLFLVKLMRNEELKSKLQGYINYEFLDCVEVKENKDGSFLVIIQKAKSKDLEFYIENEFEKLGINIIAKTEN